MHNIASSEIYVVML